MRVFKTIVILILLGFGTLRAETDLPIKLSPNPASSVVIIETENRSEVMNVEVFSVIGNRIAEITFQKQPDGRILLNVSRVPDGIYLVKVTVGAHSSVKRLKVQHN